MNGAEALLKTLCDNGVEACFANPGTSEMQMVAALDREPRMRPVLCLFEGVATGAADGYGRMAGAPACTLLHLGPGLSNGSANLHNARRAGTPIVNLVGDHATYHQANDAPLASDIHSLARPVSLWCKEARTADKLAPLAAEAVAASAGPPGGVATLIVPADAAWAETATNGPILHRRSPPIAADKTIEAIAAKFRAAKKPVVLMGSPALTEAGLSAASRLSAAGARVIMDTFVARLPRGAGRFAPDRMLYFGEMALADLAGVDLMVLAGTTKPVAFFAYPAMPTVLVPEGCAVETLAPAHEDAALALSRLADAIGAPLVGPVQGYHAGAPPKGELNAYAVGDALSRHLPENAVVSDDAVTAGLPIYMQTRGAKPHDWLMLTGGAIGQGIPVAIGAAVAAPDRKVVSLNGDGAGAYTAQGLWTIAREDLDVTVVVFANHAYRILNLEFARTGAGRPGAQSRKLLELADPRIDWVSLAKGFGLPAVRCTDGQSLDKALARSLGQSGPQLIEVALSA